MAAISDNERIVIAIPILVLGSVIGYLISFFLTPYITETVGIEAYGFVSISRTFISYATIITTALTVFIVRYISVNYHKGEVKEASAYYSSSIYACSVLLAVMFAATIVIVIFLDRILVIPSELAYHVKWLFLLMFIAFSLTTLSVPFSSSMYIRSRPDYIAGVKTISYAGEAILLIILFYFLKTNIAFVGVATLAASFIVLFLTILLGKKLTPTLRYNHKEISKEKILTLTKNGIWSSINQIGNTLNSGLDLLVANLFLTGPEMGEIAVAKSIGAMFATFCSKIYQPLYPKILKSFSQNSVAVFVRDLSRVMKICGLGGALFFSIFFSLGDCFFRLWLPKEDTNFLYLLTLLTIANYLTESIVKPLYSVYNLTVKNKVPCWITLLGGILNLLGMYILLKYTNMRCYAIVVTTAVIMISINLLFNPIYSAWCLKTSPFPFYGVIARHLCACFVLTALFYFLSKFIIPQTWIFLVLSVLLMSVLGMGIYIIIVCNKEEKKMIANVFKKTIQHIN